MTVTRRLTTLPLTTNQSYDNNFLTKLSIQTTTKMPFQFHFHSNKFLTVRTKSPLLRQQTDISCVRLRTFQFTCDCGSCVAALCCRTGAFGEAKKCWTKIGENSDKVLQQPLKCPSSKSVLLFINTVQWRHSEILQQTMVPVPCQFSAVLYKKQSG